MQLTIWAKKGARYAHVVVGILTRWRKGRCAQVPAAVSSMHEVALGESLVAQQDSDKQGWCGEHSKQREWQRMEPVLGVESSQMTWVVPLIFPLPHLPTAFCYEEF